MRVQAVGKYLRISARKARLITDLIKGKKVEDGMNLLKYSPKRGSRFVLKVLNSAVANADQNPNIDVDTLIIRNAYADEGPTLKRWRPRAMGRATRIRKRTSHVTVVLEEM